MLFSIRSGKKWSFFSAFLTSFFCTKKETKLRYVPSHHLVSALSEPAARKPKLKLEVVVIPTLKPNPPPPPSSTNHEACP